MERLLYRSTATGGVTSKDVFAIIDASERNNPARSVTGFLLHDGDRFLQLLEGPTMAVETLLAIIEQDPRHRDLEVVVRSAAEERWFPDWEMKRLISFGSVPADEELRRRLTGLEGAEPVLAQVKAFFAY